MYSKHFRALRAENRGHIFFPQDFPALNVSYPGLIGCLVVLLQPIWTPSMQYLFPQPDEADEGTKCAGDNKTTLETVWGQVLPVGNNSNTVLSPSRHLSHNMQ